MPTHFADELDALISKWKERDGADLGEVAAELTAAAEGIENEIADTKTTSDLED